MMWDTRPARSTTPIPMPVPVPSSSLAVPTHGRPLSASAPASPGWDIIRGTSPMPMPAPPASYTNSDAASTYSYTRTPRGAGFIATSHHHSHSHSHSKMHKPKPPVMVIAQQQPRPSHAHRPQSVPVQAAHAHAKPSRPARIPAPLPSPHPHWQYSKCTGRKKALCIGINYAGQPHALRGCVNDSKHCYSFLVRQCGYKPENIVVLTDDSPHQRSLPTRRNIIDAMHWLVKDARPHDSLFFHYSGHGSQTRDTNGDEIDGYDETIFPLDYQRAGHIEMHDIMVKPLPTGCRLTALFDCCHSGSSLDLPYVYDSGGRLKGSQVSNRARARKATSADVISFSGCKDGQTSADTFIDGLAVGAASHAFIKTLDAQPHQSYQELLRNVRKILNPKFKQRPQLSSSHPISWLGFSASRSTLQLATVDAAVMDDAASSPSASTTNTHSNPNLIPVDPALMEIPIDPELLREDTEAAQPEPTPEPSSPEEAPVFTQYSQAPHGVPFQPEPEYPPMEIDPEAPLPDVEPVPASPSPKPRNRKGKQCNLCHNPIRAVKSSSERIARCHVCPTVVHFECLNVAPRVWRMISTYEWLCIECKKCEICHQKGDDASILFCDSCDRGWHTTCLDPPMEKPPEGEWLCRLCPNVDLNEQEEYTGPSRKRKGKARAVSREDEDFGELDNGELVTASTSRSKARSRPIKKRPNDGQGTPSRAPKRIRREPPTPSASVSVRPRAPRRRNPDDYEDEEEEQRRQHAPPRGLFDEILTAEERDTAKTIVSDVDKQKFDRSRALADSKLKPRVVQDHPSETPEAGPSSRPLRSAFAAPAIPSPSASPAPSSTPGVRHPPESGTPALRITNIRFGEYDIETWYNAPFPEEYSNIPDGRLWICEFCLKYMKSRFGATRHRMKCKCRNPPGDEIYRDGVVSIFEVDGRKNKIYCQNLCLLSKMFLDHKSLFYDVEPFLFYVITEVDDLGARFVGYFSKEKRSPKDYNVSCIMTLPVRQRQGWGNLLIDFSYLLSKKEHRLGSPEKPLSGLGALGYKNYWLLAVMRYLATAPEHPRLEDICLATSMTMEDVHATLLLQDMITVQDVAPPRAKPTPGQSIKYPKGRKNGVARRHLQRVQTTERANDAEPGPFVPPTQYEIHWDRDAVAEYLRNWEAKKYLHLRSEKLQWSPYVLTSTNKTEAFSAADTNSLLTTERLATKRANGLINGDNMFNGLPISSSIPPTPSGAATAPSASFLGDSKSDKEEEEQVEKDRELAMKLADTPRTLRSRATASVPVTPTPTPRRSRGRPPGSGRKLNMLAAAAAEAKEQERGKQQEEDEDSGNVRQLRSREPAQHAAVATRVSPRKRSKLVESSPELEMEPEVVAERPPSTPPPPTASSNRSPSPATDPSSCAQDSMPEGMEADAAVLVVCQDESNRTAPVKTLIDEVEMEDVGPGGAMATIAAAWNRRQSQDEEDKD
ncbi:Histone acetyltransferase [Mycena kentingensis (nom. inval.)]|nr:Histone acetyltransferase [Mycena kentingensis (nom. inval.)]